MPPNDKGLLADFSKFRKADRITGSVLDADCGTGKNALFIASSVQKVTGIDFLAEPITRAKKKAAKRGVTATILVMDALTPKDLLEVFDSVIESGLFHGFNEEDRRRHVEGLASVLKAAGCSWPASLTRSRGLRPLAGAGEDRNVEAQLDPGTEVEQACGSQVPFGISVPNRHLGSGGAGTGCPTHAIPASR